MVALSTLLTTLLLSPLLFALLAAIGIALAAFRRRTAAAWLLAVSGVLLVALSVGPVGDALLRPLERRYPSFPADAPRLDAIVVLGGGVVDGAPDAGGSASPVPESFQRLGYGFILHRRTGAPLIVSGGRVWTGTGTETEADTAARVLAMLGVPEQLVTREGKSRTTWDNAREVSAILAERKATRVALVTSAYHMRRAMLAFSRAGVEAVPAPTGYLAQGRRLAAVDFLPRFESLTTSFKALREYLGLFLYAARR